MTEVAYLNSEYPSLSHTFIEREVASVRAHGVGVRTYSIRRPGPVGRMGAAHEAAARETECVLEGAALFAAQFAGLATHPLGWIRAQLAAQRLCPGGVAARLRHAVYAMEGVRLSRLVRRRGIRHVHVHMANAGAMAALLACRFDRGLTYSLTVHGSAEFFDVYRLRLDAKAAGATFVRCISNFCRAQVMAWAPPETWERMVVVPTGLDPARFAPPPDRPQDRLRILTIGRVVPIKGYELLLDACARLGADGVPWSLEVVGDGPDRAALEARARRLGISDRVTFCGAVSQDEIGGHLARANVFVVSSFMEGVPVVLMEAMASGMAVLSTRVGGVPELVADGESGILADPGSTDALVEGLRRLAGDPALRVRLGRAGRKVVEERYSIDAVGSAMADLFRRHAPEAAT